MIRDITTFILISFTLLSLASAHDAQEGKILGTIGPYTNQTEGIYTGSSSPPQLGFGLQAEGDLSTHGGIDIELFYYPKFYQRAMGGSGGGGTVISKVYKIEVPMGYRYWFTSRFSAALTFSTAYSVGNYQIVSSTAVGDQSTSASSLADYGLGGSFQWEFLSADPFFLILDGRYTYSISTNSGEDANQYGILVGLKYLIQEKYK